MMTRISRKTQSIPQIHFIRCVSFLLYSVTLIILSGPHSAKAAGQDVLGWRSGVAGYFDTPDAACRAQWVWAGMDNGYSRFIGALDTKDWWDKQCSWTSFQYLCPQETGGGLSTCGYLLPAHVYFDCSGGSEISPGQCRRNPTPERPGCYAGGGKSNPSIANPIVLSTGAKTLEATDFRSADGRFAISRFYRSFPAGRTSSVRSNPRGSALGWQFNFGLELHVGRFTGSPSSPTGEITVLTPDGSGYDFYLNSSGQFVPNPNSGAVSSDYQVEFIGTLPTNLATIYNSQTSWRVTGPDDRVWDLQTFSRVNDTTKFYVARPTQFADRDGYEWDFSYNPDTSLSSIVDTFGRTATFSWNYFYVTALPAVPGSLPFPEAIDTITFPDGTSAKYSYHPIPANSPPSTSEIERLTKVSLRNSIGAEVDSTTYHYENGDFRFAVTGITDHRNVRIATYEYDTVGRATLSKGAGSQNQFTVEYGAPGPQSTRRVTNPLGRETVYTFERIGLSLSDIRLTDIDGDASPNCPASAAEVDYGVDGFVSSTTDEEGRVTTFVRDSRGRPTDVTLADGRPEEQQIGITWHSTYNVPTEIEQPGLTSTRVYDGSGRLTSLTETDTTTHTVPYSTNGQTRAWAYTYTTGGLVATIDGPLSGAGDTVSYTYDPAGYVETYTDAVGLITTVNTVNGRGLPTEIEDPNGLTTEIAYDALGRVISMKADPAGVAAETVVEYDETGNITKITRPDATFLEMTYDDNSRVTSIERGMGQKALYAYDAMGNVTSQELWNTWSLFFKWEQAFDELGRVMEITGAGPASWAYGYDKVGNLTSVTDPNSEDALLAYDGLNRLTSFTDERTSVTSSTYGATDAPVTTTDPRSVTTSYVRNGWGEAIQEQSNDVGTIVLELNQLGQVTERTDARSVVSEYAYDDAGRVTANTYPGETGSNVAYTYDSVTGGNAGKGRLTGVTDAAGTVAYTYDILGRLTQEVRVIGSQSYTIGYAWDAAGKMTSVTYPSGRTVFYDYDGAGEVEVIRQQPAVGDETWLTFWVGYPPFGPRTGVVHANFVKEWRSFDEDGRPTRIEIVHEPVDPPTTTLSDLTFEYADKRNLTQITDALIPSNTETFTYTPNGFLETASGPYGALAYTIDGVGNITQRVKNNGTTITDVYGIATGANRLTGVTTNSIPSRSFISDAAGNITEDDSLATSTTKTYAWNHPGQLAAVEVNSVLRGDYLYDYLSRLVSRGLPATSTTLHLVHDIDGNVIAEYDAAGTLLTEYVWLGDRPMVVIADAGSSTPVFYWVSTDQLERPTMMTDESGAIVWQAKYLPFGEVSSITGSAVLDYRFPGQWFQLESGLHYNWHRHYDSTTGRYLQPDPLGMPDGPSRWSYALNSPLMNVDPDGQMMLDPKLGRPGWEIPGFPGGGRGGGSLGGGIGGGFASGAGIGVSIKDLVTFCEQLFGLPDVVKPLQNDQVKRPPESLPAFPDAKETKRKTPYQNGRGLRPRWKDKDGKILEWDSKKGELEKYSKTGKKHLGGFDKDTGRQISRPVPGRTVEP